VDAFEGAIERGESLSDVLKGLALDMAEIALKAAGNALLESILGGLLGGIGGGIGASGGRAATAGTSIPGGIGGFAKGGAFAGGRSIAAFSKGGALTNRILRRPTLFPLADGIGLAGEAGPEAVLPLARMGSGELGVKAMLARLPDAGARARECRSAGPGHGRVRLQKREHQSPRPSPAAQLHQVPERPRIQLRRAAKTMVWTMIQKNAARTIICTDL
jgi:hypothetical protein